MQTIRYAVTGTLLLACLQASATEPVQAKDEPAPAKAEPPVPQVEVKAGAYNARRDDTATKTVMNRDEVLKYGESRVIDVLKHAPGVVVSGDSVSMRGLGEGYVRILVNGERSPPGFDLRTLPPEQVERIEIMRAATAEYSMEAIAGTINVVLRQVVAKPERLFRLGTGHGASNSNHVALGMIEDRSGNLSWMVGALLDHQANTFAGRSGDSFAAPDGTMLRAHETAYDGHSSQMTTGTQTRLNWRLPEGGELNVLGHVMSERSGSASDAVPVDVIGSFPAPDYTRSRGRSDSRKVSRWLELNWVTKLWGGKLDAKVGDTEEHGAGTQTGLSATADDATRFASLRRSGKRGSQLDSRGKYTHGLFDGHAFATGWEASRERRSEDVHRVEGVEGAAPLLLDERYAPMVRRIAAFAQDEWNVTPLWSLYLGARWEGIHTASGGAGTDSVSDNHVLTPVLQTLYKFPGKSGRQLRLALTRTFKAPETAQLTARRFTSPLNTRLRPDSSGNPALRPELANGIDVTYEHFTEDDAVLSLSAGTRRLHDHIVTTLRQDAQGLWVIRPENEGDAFAHTLELDAKFPLKAVMGEGAAPLDLRVNLARNWSRVAAVPGPDNRLPAQIPFSASFGADYTREPFAVGADFKFNGGGNVRVSREESVPQFAARDLDVHVRYKASRNVEARLSLSNGLGSDGRDERRYQDATGTTRTWSRAHFGPYASFTLDFKY